MGGGSQAPESSGDEYKEDVAKLRQLCDAAADENAETAVREWGTNNEEVNEMLRALEAGRGEESRIVAKCAARLETIKALRKLAVRYEKVEHMSAMRVQRILTLAYGIAGLAGPLQGALQTNTLNARSTLKLVAATMLEAGTLVDGTAAIYRAVAHELDVLVTRAEAVLQDPSRADAGFTAAPFLGGAAGTILALGLRGCGPVGALGSVLLVGAGVLGSTGIASALYPQVKLSFARLKEQIGGIAELVYKKSLALLALGTVLTSTSHQLNSMLEILPDGSLMSQQQIAEGVTACHESLEAVIRAGVSCQYRPSAFLSLSLSIPSMEGKKEPEPDYSK